MKNSEERCSQVACSKQVDYGFNVEVCKVGDTSPCTNNHLLPLVLNRSLQVFLLICKGYVYMGERLHDSVKQRINLGFHAYHTNYTNSLVMW